MLALTCAMVLVDTVFYAALTPLVPYFSGELGLSKSIVGVLGGAFGVGVLLGSAPSGFLVARLGVKPAAILGLLTFSVSCLLFGFADEAWQLVLLRLLAGLGSALNWVAAFTWVSSRAPEGRRGEMIGTLISGAVVGALLGPVLGAAAASFGVAPSFAAVAAVGVAVALWTALTPAPGPSPSAPLRAVLAAAWRSRFFPGLLFIAFPPLLFGALTTLAPLQLSSFGWGAAAIGAAFLVASLFEAVVHPLVGRWSDRVGPRAPLLAGILASLAVLISLPFAPYAILVALLIVVAGVVFNVPLVPGTSLFTRGAEKAGLGNAPAFGATNFAWASGYALGASSGGVLADLGGDLLSYLTLAAVCLLALALLRRVA